MSAPYLEGARVFLRAPEPEDAADFARWMAAAEQRRTILASRRPWSVRAEARWIDAMSDSERDQVFTIVLRAEGRRIGTTGLHGIDPIDRAATFGIQLGEADCRGVGLGAEVTRLVVAHAFSTLNLERIDLAVFANNARAIRTYEKVGFVHEGRLRRRRFVAGEYVDELCMGLLRSEWSGAGAG